MNPIRLIAKFISRVLLPSALVMWKDWGIQILVAVSLFGHIFVAFFGPRLRYITSGPIRFLIWAASSLSTSIATVALGKLTTVQASDPKINPGYHAQLLGLLAPLILIILGNPHITTTSYIVVDNQPGFTQLPNTAASIGFVIWVLIRCWDRNSPISKLFIPLFVAGLITSFELVRSVDLAPRKTTSVTVKAMDFRKDYEDFHDEEAAEQRPLLRGPLKWILQAFYRFDYLKPHVVNWPYHHPSFVELDQTKVDEDCAEVIFTTAEIELGFMYDVLYTKGPILYTWFSIIGRFLVVFSIASALVGFSIIYKSGFLGDMYVRYTYAILIIVLAHELCKTLLIPFSDWAFVKMIKLRRKRFMARIIFCVAHICILRRRWSRTLGQLNLFEYCSQKGFKEPTGVVLRLFGKEVAAKRHWAHTRPSIPWFFMEMFYKYMRNLEHLRIHSPFTKRGNWTLEYYGVYDDVLSSSIAQEFEKSIITWHLATDICLHKLDDREETHERYRFARMISNYMMYLMALRPNLLSSLTTNVTIEYARTNIDRFCQNNPVWMAFRDLLDGPLPRMEIINEDRGIQETIITRGWDLLSDTRQLAIRLQDMSDGKWDLISSMWVEMLCYAAYNCPVYQHGKAIGGGGELLTNIWLILSHNTNRLSTNQPNRLSTNQLDILEGFHGSS